MLLREAAKAESPDYFECSIYRMYLTMSESLKTKREANLFGELIELLS